MAAVACALVAAGLVSLQGPALPSLSGGLFALQSIAALVALAKSVLLHAGWMIAWSCAFAVALALTLPLRSFAANAALAWAGAVALVAARGPLAVLLALVGATLGSALALDLRTRRARYTPATVIALGGLSLLLLALAFAPFRTEPALPASAPASSDARRSLAHLIDGKDPRKIPDGETRTLALSAEQLDQLVAWAADASVHARTKVELREGGFEARASLPLPHSPRWLELWASADVALRDGQPAIEDARVQIGWLYLPSWLMGIPVRWTLARLQTDPDVQAVLSSVRELTVHASEAAVTYSHVTTGGGLAARVAWGDGASQQIRASTEAQIGHLLGVLAREPAGDTRMTRALREAFALAMERSREQSALQENRAALMALGAVLGSEKVLRALGERASPERTDAMYRVRDATTLRGRNDWTRHFAISGAITVLSAVAPSNAVGLLKEELDADGGSGFSFGDLLADFSGTTFAEHAIESEDSARALQRKVATLAGIDAFFPRADGLPEGLQDEVFQREYGGIGGPGYQQLVAEIDRRVRACALYR